MIEDKEKVKLFQSERVPNRTGSIYLKLQIEREILIWPWPSARDTEMWPSSRHNESDIIKKKSGKDF